MTTYSISLDDIDLSLLPVRTYQSNGFLKKEHYQFQIMREPEPKREPSTNTIFYTCHTCAIEVPAAFAREHTASVKHRANASIANAAAERMRALVHASSVPVVAQPDARFCANCATIVDDEHEKTKEHRVAVMHDNLLCELMKAYVTDEKSKENSGNQRFGNQDEKQYVSNTFGSYEHNYKICDAKEAEANDNRVKITPNAVKVNDSKQEIANCKTDDNNSENLREREESGNADVSKNNVNTNITENVPPVNSNVPTSRWVKVVPQPNTATPKGTSSNDLQATVANQKDNMELKAKQIKAPYEKELCKFMDSNNIFQVKESYNRIQVKVNDDTVNVYSDHFHSFHRMYNGGNIECIVCNITFNDKKSEEHIFSLNHMTAVAKIGNDGEYVREIEYKHYSHCILCNQKINNMNVAKHKLSQHHASRKANNVRSIVKSNGTPTAERDDNSNDKSKVTVENNKENSTSNSKVTNDVEEVTNKHPYEEIAGELICRVCDCRVPKDVTNRRDHLKGARHLNNLRMK